MTSDTCGMHGAMWFVGGIAFVFGVLVVLTWAAYPDRVKRGT